ncbi:MAG: PA3496 family putative envelope integrity protein, partial [Gammaproteobacteria bacterium]
VLNVALDDDTFESQDVTVRDNTITPDERARMNAEARRRIEAMREDAALKRALDDDIFDY